MKICVFCSASEVDSKYSVPALETVREFAILGHSLVWGGSDTGLMRDVASMAQGQGVPIFGVSVEFLREKARLDANEMTIAKDLSERKALMMEHSDAFLVLPGGIGTLDEVTEIIELKKHSVHNKKVVFLNTEGFYEGLASQLMTMAREGFLTRPLDDYATFADGPADAIRQLGLNASQA